MSILTVENLKVHYLTQKGFSHAVDGVSFEINEGEYLGLVGESGCGKSTIAKAILQTLPANGQVRGGSVAFRGTDLLALKKNELNRLRWKDIALIPQSAMNALDPVYRIREQMLEAIEVHEKIKPAAALDKIESLFELVGLNKARLRDYPHQFSGGMRQRAMIAMSLVLDPTLIIADEPTTGLDVIVQDQILHRIREIHESLIKVMLLITHNMAVVAENCNRIAVMYAGKIMEYGGAAVLAEPFHPYTLGLINAFPSVEDQARELISIPGAPPDLLTPPDGCRFHERCPFAEAICDRDEPPLYAVADDHVAACHFWRRADYFRKKAAQANTWEASTN